MKYSLHSYYDIIYWLDSLRTYGETDCFFDRTLSFIYVYNMRNFPLKMKEEVYFFNDSIKPFQIDL
jgi:hypothetical protein